MIRITAKPLLLCFLFVLISSITLTAQETVPYWPSDSWRTATPEAQGIRSALLTAMLEAIAEHHYPIDSIMVIRHGYVVLDVYVHPYQPGIRHIIHSCTKSITSILVGIAIDQGYIAGVDVPMLTLFSDWDAQNVEAEKEAITLKHMLMMAPGLDCRDSARYASQGLYEMLDSRDWVQHVLDLPTVYEPGTHFEYCNGVTFLLGAAVQEATEVPLRTYADEMLFLPLGITDYSWDAAPEDRLITWGGLRMLPPDMAKIGYLMLHAGVWNGEQIVSADWVAASTTPYIISSGPTNSYGYQWWIANNYYAANGYAGQHIFVVPKQDMVVVLTSSLGQNNNALAANLFRQYIYPAVSDTPLPEAPENAAQLATAIDVLANPAPQPIPTIPDFAEAVSGKSFVIENAAGSAIQRLTMLFEAGAPEAYLITVNAQGETRVPVGLDGRFRWTEVDGRLRAYRGSFTDNAFVVEMRDVYGPTRIIYRGQIDGTHLTLTIEDDIRDAIVQIKGTLAEE